MPETDIAVLGAGRTGRQVAALSAALGLSVVLFERERPLPLPRVAEAALADAARMLPNGALPNGTGSGDRPAWEAARARVDAALRDAAPDAAAARFEGMGIEVVHAPARFAAPDRIAAAGREWRFRRALLDVGAAPRVPDLPGLEGIPWFTPATLPLAPSRPDRLIVLDEDGAGLPVAQAAARLGAAVTVVAPARLALRRDVELADGLRRVLLRAGMTILEGHGAVAVDGGPGAVTLILDDGRRVAGTHLLLAMGEVPRIAGLDLGAGNVAGGPGGMAVTDSLRSTTNRRVWAAGRAADLRHRHPLGGSADAHLGIVARNMVFRLPARLPDAPPPRLLRTDPAILEVGLDAFDAEEDGETVRVWRHALAHTERAAAAGVADGLVKLVADGRNRLLGAGVLGPGAEEMAAVLSLAVSRRLSLAALAGMDLPGPAYAEAIRQAAGASLGALVTSGAARRLAALAKRLP